MFISLDPDMLLAIVVAQNNTAENEAVLRLLREYAVNPTVDFGENKFYRTQKKQNIGSELSDNIPLLAAMIDELKKQIAATRPRMEPPTSPAPAESPDEGDDSAKNWPSIVKEWPGNKRLRVIDNAVQRLLREESASPHELTTAKNYIFGLLHTDHKLLFAIIASVSGGAAKPEWVQSELRRAESIQAKAASTIQQLREVLIDIGMIGAKDNLPDSPASWKAAIDSMTATKLREVKSREEDVSLRETQLEQTVANLTAQRLREIEKRDADINWRETSLEKTLAEWRADFEKKLQEHKTKLDRAAGEKERKLYEDVQTEAEKREAELTATAIELTSRENLLQNQAVALQSQKQAIEAERQRALSQLSEAVGAVHGVRASLQSADDFLGNLNILTTSSITIIRSASLSGDGDYVYKSGEADADGNIFVGRWTPQYSAPAIRKVDFECEGWVAHEDILHDVGLNYYSDWVKEIADLEKYGHKGGMFNDSNAYIAFLDTTVQRFVRQNHAVPPGQWFMPPGIDKWTIPPGVILDGRELTGDGGTESKLVTSDCLTQLINTGAFAKSLSKAIADNRQHISSCCAILTNGDTRYKDTARRKTVNLGKTESHFGDNNGRKIAVRPFRVGRIRFLEATKK